MRNLTDEEFWAAHNDPFELKMIKYACTSALVDYLAANMPLSDARGVVDLMKPAYDRMWKVYLSHEKVPDWHELKSLADKYYKEYKGV